MEADADYLSKLGISSIDLLNTGNIAYTGPVFLGDPLQGTNSSQFLYDSGSGFLLVTDSECETCNTQYFNSSASASSSVSNLTEIGYGNLNLEGKMLQDTVCLSDFGEDTCASEMSFFSVDK